ncbi:MAG: hypothetical protein LBH44_00385 [Treponema sp.]|jgi:hypothetical protein|nr:hypothetical protein [Treponema sp.]
MKGKWKRTCMVLGDEYKHIATRLLDTSEPMHGGNVEHIGGYTTDKEAVEKLCDYLNKIEGEE